jgi:hypothetical protein
MCWDQERNTLIVGTSSSNVYFMNCNTYQVALYLQANNSQIVGIDAFENNLASFDVKGNLKLWDVGVRNKCKQSIPKNPLNPANGTCVSFGDAPFLLQGFSSGDISCINGNTGSVEWSILKSHKNGVTTLLMVRSILSRTKHTS